jgi:hypothetical protein
MRLFPISRCFSVEQLTALTFAAEICDILAQAGCVGISL